MFKSELMKIIAVLGLIFCIGSHQTVANAKTAAVPKTPTTATPKISVPDKGVTIVLRSPTSENAQLVKYTKGKNGKVNSEEMQGFEVSLPENTVVRFIVDSEVKPPVSDVTITVEDHGAQTREQFKDLAKFKSQDRILKNRIQYICTFQLKAGAEVKTLTRVVTVVPTPALSGIKATVGPFISNRSDENYINTGGKIAFGNQDTLSNALGVLVHLPFGSHNFQKFRCALALSAGLSLDKYSISNEGLSITSVPPTLGVSLLFAGPTDESLITITGGGILKTVKELDGYKAGQPLPSGIDSPPTRDVNRVGWVFAITFSYDIFHQLGLKISQK